MYINYFIVIHGDIKRGLVLLFKTESLAAIYTLTVFMHHINPIFKTAGTICLA